jgi:hypothetical protein
MANARYCRFENTLRDLKACQEALDDDDYKGASETERVALLKLISLCSEISSEYDNITINFDDDEDDELLDEDEGEEEDEDEDENIFEHQPPAFLFK